MTTKDNDISFPIQPQKVNIMTDDPKKNIHAFKGIS